MSTQPLEDSFSPWPFPVIFVCRQFERWSELYSCSASELPNPEDIHGNIINNEDCWIVLTYLYLKKRNLNVYLSKALIPGQICIVSSLDLGIRDLSFSSFIVGCRSDGPEPALCDFSIVQNEANIKSETDVFIPHWPQPGLIPRDQKRGSKIRKIVYKGSENNLYYKFRSPNFQAELEQLGIQLKISGRGDLDTPVNWHDYSDADLVLAARDLTEMDAFVKPASKLVNAWMAGVPALLGPEPAFQSLRQSPLDYIEIKTPQDALEAIKKLQADPDLYQQMITNGFERAKAFRPESLIEKWYEVLAHPVANEYQKWLESPKITHMSKFIRKAIRQKRAVARAKFNRMHGVRILSGELT